MLCCVVLLSIVGIVFRRGNVDDPFPPRARRGVDGLVPDVRPSVGLIVGDATATAATATSTNTIATATTAARATALRWSAAGVVIYVSAVAALLGVGAGESMDGSGLHWFARDFTFALLAAVALAAAARGPAACPAGRRLALALIGIGSAWTVLGLIDMHVFMLFEIAGGQMLPDAVFHGAGVLALLSGVFLLQRSKARGATARATTTAQVDSYADFSDKVTA